MCIPELPSHSLGCQSLAMEEQPASKRRSVFKRGQKQELFDDGQEPDEQAELLGKLGELHSVWAMERTG